MSKEKKTVDEEEERRELRHKRRIRTQVLAYFVLLLIIGAIGAGGYFGGKYLISFINKNKVNDNQEVEAVSEDAVSDDDIPAVISSPEEFVDDTPEEEVVEDEATISARQFVDTINALGAEEALKLKIANMFIVRPEAMMDDVQNEIAFGDKTSEALSQYGIGGIVYSDNNVNGNEEGFFTLITQTKDFYNTKYNAPLWVMYDGENPNAYIDNGVDFKIVSADEYDGGDGKLLTCLKEFPIQDGTDTASISESMDDLAEVRLLPFQTAIYDGGVDAIFVSNANVASATGEDIPASLSSVMITDVLRNNMGFDGIIITDYLDDDVITGKYSEGEAAILAIKSGADMILCPDNFKETYEEVLTAVQQGEISEDRIDESLVRIYAAKYRKMK